MAQYKLKRVNATKWDLKQEQLQSFEAMRVYVGVMGKGRILTEVVLVNLIMDHGADIADKLVKAFIGRGFFALDRLQGLIDGSEPFEWKSPFTNERQPSHRGAQSEPRSVESFLGAIAKKAEAALVEYPTDDHVYDGPAAGKWMLAKGVGFDHYQEYFSILPQRDADGKNLLQLKSEYR